MKPNEFTNALSAGFKLLRKRGYVARQSWQCCMSCGCAALPEGTKQYAFYHRQNTADLREALSARVIKREDVGVYLSWGGNGGAIVKCFEECGLKVDWDGSDSTKIWVGLPDPAIDHDKEYRAAFEQFVCA